MYLKACLLMMAATDFLPEKVFCSISHAQFSVYLIIQL